MDFVGRDLFTAPLQTTLRQFEEADNFGSLIRPDVTDVDGMLRILESKNVSGQLFLSMTHEKVLQALRQADYLSPRYHVVIANPPYIDLGNMNPGLKDFIESRYEETKQNLDVTFIQRCLMLSVKNGYTSMITQRSWMFLSRIEEFRCELVTRHCLTTMIYLGPGTFPEIQGEKVQNTAFVFQKSRQNAFDTYFYKLTSEQGKEKERAFLNRKHQYLSTVDRLHSIPGFPIAFWASDALCAAFDGGKTLNDVSDIRVGLDTGDNASFVRAWHEPSIRRVGFSARSLSDFRSQGSRWVPHSKGGPFRKWFGNISEILAFDENDYNSFWSKETNCHQGNFISKKDFLYPC